MEMNEFEKVIQLLIEVNNIDINDEVAMNKFQNDKFSDSNEYHKFLTKKRIIDDLVDLYTNFANNIISMKEHDIQKLYNKILILHNKEIDEILNKTF